MRRMYIYIIYNYIYYILIIYYIRKTVFINIYIHVITYVYTYEHVFVRFLHAWQIKETGVAKGWHQGCLRCTARRYCDEVAGGCSKHQIPKSRMKEIGFIQELRILSVKWHHVWIQRVFFFPGGSLFANFLELFFFSKKNNLEGVYIATKVQIAARSWYLATSLTNGAGPKSETVILKLLEIKRWRHIGRLFVFEIALYFEYSWVPWVQFLCLFGTVFHLEHLDYGRFFWSRKFVNSYNNGLLACWFYTCILSIWSRRAGLLHPPTGPNLITLQSFSLAAFWYLALLNPAI